MKSLKRKLRVVTCIICIVCLGITAAISYNIASSKMSQKEEEKAELSAEKNAQEIETWLNGYATYLEVTAGTMEAQKMAEPENIAQYLQELLQNQNEDGIIYDIYFTSEGNRMTAGSGYEADGSVDFTKKRTECTTNLHIKMLIPADMSLHFQKKWSGMEKLSEF